MAWRGLDRRGDGVWGGRLWALLCTAAAIAAPSLSSSSSSHSHHTSLGTAHVDSMDVATFLATLEMETRPVLAFFHVRTATPSPYWRSYHAAVKALKDTDAASAPGGQPADAAFYSRPSRVLPVTVRVDRRSELPFLNVSFVPSVRLYFPRDSS